MLNEPVEAVRAFATGIEGRGAAVEAALAAAADASVVLLGEASHGTHEFYAIRADITKALIERHGFNLVAVEADWPDAYQVNRHVQRASADQPAREALRGFRRFPRWMWRNHVVVEFVDWLRHHNAGRSPHERAGFYGLDLYSLHRSMECVLEYLEAVDPHAAARARQRFDCFEAYGEDMQTYGYAAGLGLAPSCEREVVAQLVDLRRRAADYVARDGQIAADEFFFAEQNARVVRHAEQYYRAMFAAGPLSWNLRDQHMMHTLEALVAHVRSRSGHARAVVWAHNSHLGDARATSMADRGELNLGQLAKTGFGPSCRSIGFMTHHGHVTAASEWEDPPALMRVRDSLPGSWEHLFHDAGLGQFLLRLDNPEVASALAAPRLERMIGVIYRPRTERASHYVTAALPKQFDAVIHIDRTTALEPLETWARHEVDLPETFPSGM